MPADDHGSDRYMNGPIIGPEHYERYPMKMEKRAHKKHQHDHFKEDLEEAIMHFESSKESYANTLLYPEVCMARVPFICPVPTALTRGVSIHNFTPDNAVGDTFMWSFVPEALSNLAIGTTHAPFYYGTASGTSNQSTLGNHVTRETLFPGVSFSDIDAMRVVGASITVTQTQRLVDRAGYGLISRVYGIGDAANVVNKNVVINSTYKDEANYSSTGTDDHLRMIYAPGDFSDLHLSIFNSTQKERDQEKYPVLQGFIQGFGAATISVTFEFNVVIEYVPKPNLMQMVKRRAVVVNAGE